MLAEPHASWDALLSLPLLLLLLFSEEGQPRSAVQGFLAAGCGLDARGRPSALRFRCCCCCLLSPGAATTPAAAAAAADAATKDGSRLPESTEPTDGSVSGTCGTLLPAVVAEAGSTDGSMSSMLGGTENRCLGRAGAPGAPTACCCCCCC